LEELVQHSCITHWETFTYQRATHLRIVRGTPLIEQIEATPLQPILAGWLAGEADDEPVRPFALLSSAVKQLHYYGFPLHVAEEMEQQYGEPYLLDKLRLLEQVHRVGKPPPRPAGVVAQGHRGQIKLTFFLAASGRFRRSCS